MIVKGNECCAMGISMWSYPISGLITPNKKEWNKWVIVVSHEVSTISVVVHEVTLASVTGTTVLCDQKGNNKITELEQFYKGKVKSHKYINRQNQSTTGKLWKP